MAEADVVRPHPAAQRKRGERVERGRGAQPNPDVWGKEGLPDTVGGKGCGLAPTRQGGGEGGMAQLQSGHVGGGTIWPCGEGPALNHCSRLGILAAGRGGGIPTAKFPTHKEASRTDSKALQATIWPVDHRLSLPGIGDYFSWVILLVS